MQICETNNKFVILLKLSEQNRTWHWLYYQLKNFEK